jgi:hypothetical protein
VREVIAYYNQHHPDSTVLVASGESILAGLEGTVYINHWHQYPTVARLRAASTVPDMVRLMQSWKVEYFISRKPSADEPVRPPALKAMLGECTVPEYELGDYYLARLQPDCSAARISAAPAQPSVVAHRGFYDDIDPSIVFRGDWDHDQSFAEADRHTVSYSNVPGAEIAFAFEGERLTYTFTRAPNRGIAAVTIDGAGQPAIDLYSPKVEWQASKKFCCFAPGRHLAVIRVTGEHSPQSSGRYVDLDSLTVW